MYVYVSHTRQHVSHQHKHSTCAAHWYIPRVFYSTITHTHTHDMPVLPTRLNVLHYTFSARHISLYTRMLTARVLRGVEGLGLFHF